MKLAVILGAVVVTGVSITLALLSAGPKEKVNPFTAIGSEDIDVEIEEEFDEEEAGRMKPNVPVTKEPLLTNVSEAEIDIYVAMQVVLVSGGGTEFNPDEVLTEEQYTKLMELIYIRYDKQVTATNYNTGSGKWAATSATGNGAIYIWTQKLAKDASTEVLFKDVMLKKEAGNADADWIQEELGGFEIIVRGAAVQAEGITIVEAETELLQLLAY